ncbi:MAG: hypothetical protein ACTHKK_03635, partial [Candidatus Nitrosocosmicus sp.]
GLIISEICTNLGIFESTIDTIPIPINIPPQQEILSKKLFLKHLPLIAFYIPSNYNNLYKNRKRNFIFKIYLFIK